MTTVRMAKNAASCCSPVSGEIVMEERRFVDPVCGMTMAKDDPKLSLRLAGAEYHFCSSNCLKVFTREGGRLLPGERILRRKNRAVPIGVFGALSNLLGVTMILGLAGRNSIVFRNILFNRLSSLNMGAVRWFLAAIGVTAIIFSITAS